MLKLSELTLEDSPKTTFAKKKNLSENFLNSKYINNTITFITNYASFQFTKILSNIYIYGIKITNETKSELNNDQRFPLFLLRKIFKEPSVQEILKKFFIDHLLTGNTLFARSEQPPAEVIFQIFYRDAKAHYVNQEELEELLKEPDNKPSIYTITLVKRIKVADYTKEDYQEHSEHIKRYVNLVISDTMRKINYKKDLRFGYDDLDKSKFIPAQNGIYFYQSYKITTGFYENNNIFLKIVPKFRMIREETYLDRYQWLLKSNNYSLDEFNKWFADLCKGRSGVTVYSDDKVKIDDVIFENPTNITFTDPNGKKVSLIEYYRMKYNVQIENKVQPIFKRISTIRNRQTGDKEDRELYYMPKLLYIAGKFEDETIKIDSVLKISPTERIILASTVMEDIIRHLTTKTKSQEPNKSEIYLRQDINFKPIETKGYVLSAPTLKFDKGITVQPDHSGKFDITNIKPYRDLKLSNWLFLLLDTSLDDAYWIYQQLVKASQTLGITIPEPQTHEIKQQSNISNYREYFVQYFDSLYQSRKENKIEFIMLIQSKYCKTNSKTKLIYSVFKDSLERSKLQVSSQVVIKESALRAKMSYYSNVLFQIWAKRDLEVWGLKSLSTSVQSQTMIAAYAVNHNPSNGKVLTSLCLSFEAGYSNYYFFSDYSEPGSAFISTQIGALLRKALTMYVKQHLKYSEEPLKIKNLLIYREGLNEGQRKMALNFELTQIKEAFDEELIRTHIPEPKICLVFASGRCDTKMFEVKSQRKEEGKERYYLNRSLQVENVPVGSLLESTVVSHDRWEFYMNSAMALAGTSNPTHYIVGYDDTGLEADFIYKMTFNLTFLYYNNNKSVRFPAPLHNIMRRNKFIITHLKDVPKSKLNISL